MVNPGRPSKGCRLCKQRRIKCDEARPTCARCRRSGRECPGYQDRWEIIFHDETEATEQRARVYPRRASSKTHTPSLVVKTLPGPSLAECAIASGLNAFSCLETPSHYQGWLDLVAPMYQASDLRSSVRAAADALAVGWIWRKTRIRGLEEPSYHHYHLALRATQAALTDPERMLSDETLLSVLLLANFECLHSSDGTSAAYRRHIEGAIRLVELRGAGQLEQLTSMRLFWNVRACLFSARIGTSAPIVNPPNFDWLPPSDSVRDPTPLSRFQRIAAEVIDLRARCKRTFRRSKELDPLFAHELIAHAQVLEMKLEHWRSTLPDHYEPRRMSLYDEPRVEIRQRRSWDGSAWAYPGLLEASADAHYWVLSLYIHATIVRCVRWLDVAGGTHHEALSAMPQFQPIQAAVDAICAITPFSLGDIETIPADDNDRHRANRAMFSMTSPLVAALSTEGIPPLQREWIRGRFFRTAEVLQIELAKLMAQSPPVLIFQGRNPYRTGHLEADELD